MPLSVPKGTAQAGALKSTCKPMTVWEIWRQVRTLACQRPGIPARRKKAGSPRSPVYTLGQKNLHAQVFAGKAKETRQGNRGKTARHEKQSSQVCVHVRQEQLLRGESSERASSVSEGSEMEAASGVRGDL